MRGHQTQTEKAAVTQHESRLKMNVANQRTLPSKALECRQNKNVWVAYILANRSGWAQELVVGIRLRRWPCGSTTLLYHYDLQYLWPKLEHRVWAHHAFWLKCPPCVKVLLENSPWAYVFNAAFISHGPWWEKLASKHQFSKNCPEADLPIELWTPRDDTRRWYTSIGILLGVVFFYPLILLYYQGGYSF